MFFACICLYAVFHLLSHPTVPSRLKIGTYWMLLAKSLYNLLGIPNHLLSFWGIHDHL